MTQEDFKTDLTHLPGDTFESWPLDSAITRVLLVDDDEDEFIITRGLLEEAEAFARHDTLRHRFHLDWVSRYDVALQAIHRGEHDVYLVDYRLGARSGLDLLREATAGGCRRPVILLTGQGDPDVDVEATRAGAADYLVKDKIDGPLLERSIRYAIAQKAAQERLHAAAGLNARLTAAIEHSSVGVMMIDARYSDLPVLYVNAEFSRITGWAAEEIVGRNRDALSGSSKDILDVLDISPNVKEGQTVSLNHRRDGTPYWAEIQTWPVFEDNRVVTYVAFITDVSERVESERALRESQGRLAAAQRLTHLGSFSLDVESAPFPEVQSVQWSDEMYRILGLDPATVPSSREKYLSVVHPEDRERAKRALLHMIAGKEPYQVQVRILRPDGEERVVRVQAEVETWSAPVTRVLGTILDVTEQVRAETALRETQQRLRDILQGAPLVLWSVDAKGRFTLIEGRPLDLLSSESRPRVGDDYTKLFQDHDQISGLLADGLAGKSGSRLVVLEDLTFDVRFSPHWDGEGRIVGVNGVSLDVTEQVRAQRAERESKEHFERTIANVPGMVYRFRRTGAGRYKFEFVSQGCRMFFGEEPEALLADYRIISRAMEQADCVRLQNSVEVSSQTLEPWEFECLIHTPSGDKWARGTSRPVRQSNGDIVWDGLLMDITASKEAEERLRHSESQLAQAQRIAHIGSWEWQPVLDQVTWSPEMFRIFGVEGEKFDFTLSGTSQFLHPDDRKPARRAILQALTSQIPSEYQWRLIRRSDGAERVIRVLCTVENGDDGRVSRLFGTAQDVTEIIEAERALRESEQRYALAAQGANDGLWDWNLRTNQMYLSPRWQAMSGLAQLESLVDPEEWFTRVHVDDAERLQAQLSLHLVGDTEHFQAEYRLKHSDGSYRWMVSRGVTVRDDGGKPYRMAGSQTDITDRKLAEEQLRHNAFYDGLTGLPNRALFVDRLERCVSRLRRRPENAFAVLFLDIDRFKKINDSLGHLPGDTLLVEAAKRFASCLRPGDTVARLGGDEFAILLDDLDDQMQATRIADRIQREMLRPFNLGNREIFVSVSIGIAFSRGSDEKSDEMLRNADTAMYRAKSLGRARHEIFEVTMHQSAVRLLEMESDLWRAVDRNELRLHYQPIINLKTGRVAGFEALVRWQHPDRGLVSPGDFISLAEETGLIVPFGWWVLNEACRQTRQWQRAMSTEPPLFISVNLSTKQFSQGDLIDRVCKAVETSGLDPRTLKLELTETVLMENTDSASAALLELKQLGVRLAMDDFGTGYSSLSYLHRFPFDTLKIDRAFVSGMQANQKNAQIVSTIMSLAHSLNMCVVAEGVETKEQLEKLRVQECAYAQGFYMSKPLTPEAVDEFLSKGLEW